MYSSDNIFQKIIQKEISASIVYENDSVCAFLDINPVEKGHTLVVPKEPIEHILDISDALIGDFWYGVHYVSKGVMSAMSADGCNISTNIGACAGQDVFHAHIHIIPRFNDKERSFTRTSYSEGEMKAVADMISAVL